MMPPFVRSSGLALLLLLATLCSAPLGSMEQGGGEGGSLPAVEAGGGARLEKRLALPDRSLTPGAQRHFHLSPGCGPAGDLPAGQAPGAERAEAAPASPPRLCERLPYHANAPPTA